MKKYLLAVIAGCGILFTLLLNSCSGKNAASQPEFGGPVPVTTAEVKLSGVSYYDEYPGTVVALNQVELRPQVNGYITGIYFKEGDRVTKGNYRSFTPLMPSFTAPITTRLWLTCKYRKPI